jgi:hypothetical protein
LNRLHEFLFPTPNQILVNKPHCPLWSFRYPYLQNQQDSGIGVDTVPHAGDDARTEKNPKPEGLEFISLPMQSAMNKLKGIQARRA